MSKLRAGPKVRAFGQADRRINGRFQHQALTLIVVERRKVVEAVPLLREVLLHERALERGVRIVDEGRLAHRTFSIGRGARRMTGRATLLTFRVKVAHYVDYAIEAIGQRGARIRSRDGAGLGPPAPHDLGRQPGD